MRSLKLFLILFLFCHLSLPAQISFRVMTYNGLNVNGYEPQFINRLPYFQKVIQAVNPDILVMQEIDNARGADSILRVINQGAPAYARAPFINAYDSDNMLFYKPSRVAFLGQDTISTPLRAITEYQLSIGGQPLRIYSCHLKAGEDYSAQRLNEVTILRNYLNTLPAGTEFLIAGDMNFYTSSEPGYQKFIADESNNNGRARDLSSQVGNWSNNYAFRTVHTQSTRIRALADSGSTGGLDDRFDFIFTSYALNDGQKIEYLNGSYKVYGNDGNHFNDSINRLPNSAVPDSIAIALHYASDHLPVIADFISYPDAVTDPDIIINEILHGNTYKDAVELLVLKPGGIDLRGWILTDLYSPTATPTSTEGLLILPDRPFLQNVPRYTRIVLIADAGGTIIPLSFEDTLAVQDSMLVLLPVTLGGSLNHYGTSRFSLSTNDNVVLLTGPDLLAGTLMDKVSYGGDMSGWTTGNWSNNLTLNSGYVAQFIHDAFGRFNNDNGLIGWNTSLTENQHSLGRMNNGQTIAIKENDDLPVERVLYQNTPNPFNPSTIIRYHLPVSGPVSLKIYNLLGQEVYTLVHGAQQAGRYEVRWDGKDNYGNAVASGIYIYRLTTGNIVQSKKMILIR